MYAWVEAGGLALSIGSDAASGEVAVYWFGSGWGA